MPQPKKTILHVDDEADVRKVVKLTLEREGFTVVGAESGKQAIDKFADNQFELILLDIMMPDMTGWDLLTRITEIKQKHNVVFLTVLEVSKERLQELKNSGVKDYIVKPFDHDDFVALLFSNVI